MLFRVELWGWNPQPPGDLRAREGKTPDRLTRRERRGVPESPLHQGHAPRAPPGSLALQAARARRQTGQT